MPPKHTGNGMITNRYLQGSYMNIFWAQLAKEKDCRQLLEILLLLLQNFQENPVFTIPKFGISQPEAVSTALLSCDSKCLT